MTPSIAIIGAGPCGLTLARLLECNGIDYVVYERDESEDSNRRGGSLDIHAETGQRALKEAGLFEEFKKHARYDDAVLTLANQQGERVFQAGQGRDAPEIDRVALRQILLDSIPKDKIRWGHLLKGTTQDEDGHHILQFMDGASASGFKLVIGADGAWSKVRPSVRLFCFGSALGVEHALHVLTATSTLGNRGQAIVLGQPLYRIKNKPQ
jgi:2-polyprenyl-6-methoxyphenol hydroxylase-like FAD-dependent oxidoreductase